MSDKWINDGVEEIIDICFCHAGEELNLAFWNIDDEKFIEMKEKLRQFLKRNSHD